MITNSAFSSFNVWFPSFVSTSLLLSHGWVSGSFLCEKLLWGADPFLGKWFKWVHFYTFENGNVVLLRSWPFYVALVRIVIAMLNIIIVHNFWRQGFLSSGLAYLFRLVNSLVGSWLECQCTVSLVQLFVMCRTKKSLIYSAVILCTSIGNWIGVLSHFMQMNIDNFKCASMDPSLGLSYVALLVVSSTLSSVISIIETPMLKFFWTMTLLIVLLKGMSMFFHCPSYYGMLRCTLIGGVWLYMFLNASVVMGMLLFWKEPSPYKPLLLPVNLIVSHFLSFAILSWKRERASKITLSNMNDWTEVAIYDLFTLCGEQNPLFRNVMFHDALNDRFPFSPRLILMSNQILMSMQGQVKKVFTSTLRFAWKQQLSWLYRMRARVLLELATPEALPSDKWSSIVEQQVVEIVERCEACHACFWSSILSEDLNGVITKARILHKTVSKATDFFQQIDNSQMMTDGISEIYLKFIGEIEAHPGKFVEFAQKNLLKKSVSDNVAKMKSGVALEGIIPRASEMKSNIAQYPKMEALCKSPSMSATKQESLGRLIALCYVIGVSSFWFLVVFISTLFEMKNLSAVKRSSAVYDRWSNVFSMVFTFVSESLEFDLKFGLQASHMNLSLREDKLRYLENLRAILESTKELHFWNIARTLSVHSVHQLVPTFDDLANSDFFQTKILSSVNSTNAMGKLLANDIPMLDKQLKGIQGKQHQMMRFVAIATVLSLLLQLMMLERARVLVEGLARQAWAIPMGRVARVFKYFHSQSRTATKAPTNAVILSYSWLLGIPLLIGVTAFGCSLAFSLLIERHINTSQAFLNVICSFPVFISSMLIPFRNAVTEEEWRGKQSDYCFVGNVLYRLVGRDKNVTQFLMNCQTQEMRRLSDAFEPVDSALSLFGLSRMDVTDALIELELIIPRNRDSYRGIENREEFLSPSAMVTAFNSTRRYSRMVGLLIAAARDNHFLLELFCLFIVIIIWVLWIVHMGIHCYVFYHLLTFSSFLRRILMILPETCLDQDDEPVSSRELVSPTKRILDVLPCGIVILDQNSDRTYDNKYAREHFFPIHTSGKHTISGQTYLFRSTTVNNLPLGPLDEPWKGSMYISFVNITDVTWLETEITRLARLRIDYENSAIPQYFTSRRSKVKKHESFVFTQCSFIFIDIPKRTRDLDTKISLMASGRPTFMHMDRQGSFLFVTFVSTDNSNSRMAKRDAFHTSIDIYELLMSNSRTADSKLVTMSGPMVYKFTSGSQLSLMIYGSAIVKALRILNETGEGEMSFSASMKTTGDSFFPDRKRTCPFNGTTLNFCTIDSNHRQRRTYSQLNIPMSLNV